jgi:YfiH family protein
LPTEPLWLRQTHGLQVANAAQAQAETEADASVARQPDQVCAVMTADCLPVLFCDQAGTVVGAAHAGWRGLADGILEQTVAAMQVPPGQIMAWLGPAIGPDKFEVGEDVLAVFVADLPDALAAFQTIKSDKWLADIYQLARLRLARLGVHQVYGGGLCTYTDATRFYSYRRDGVTGRIASLIWLADA